jgi:hypothetical protein
MATRGRRATVMRHVHRRDQRQIGRAQGALGQKFKTTFEIIPFRADIQVLPALRTVIRSPSRSTISCMTTRS